MEYREKWRVILWMMRKERTLCEWKPFVKATESLADVNDDREVLRELYDVDVDSQEQKDLELLEGQDIKVYHDAPTRAAVGRAE